MELARKIYNLLYFSRFRYLRARMVPTGNGIFYIKGQKRNLSGDHFLAMLDEIVFQDAYQLKKIPVDKIKTIVDAGANIGIFSLWASSFFSESYLYAFEPNVSLAPLFHKNLDGTKNYKLVSAALSSKNESGYLDISGNHTESFLISSVNSKADSFIDCEIIAFNTFQESIETKVDLLKLDCEGAEYDILFNSDISNVGWIVGELHTTTVYQPSDAIDHLRQAGFDVTYKPFIDPKAGVFFAKNNKI